MKTTKKPAAGRKAKPSPWWEIAPPTTGKQKEGKASKPGKRRTPDSKLDTRRPASQKAPLSAEDRKTLARMLNGIAASIYEAAMDGLKRMADPPFGVKRKWGREQEEWLADWRPRAEKTAKRIGSLAATSAIDNLLGSGFASVLAKQARSHAGSKGIPVPRKRKGGKPAKWKERVRKEILQKHRAADEGGNVGVIDRAIQLGIILEEETSPGKAEYLDNATLRRIAANKQAMSTAISALKKTLKPKTKK